MEKTKEKSASKPEKAPKTALGLAKKNKPNSAAKKEVQEIKASARYIRMSPRKVRLVIEQIKGQSVVSALDTLRFVKRAAASPVYKLLQSALANAEHNFQIDKADLYIKKIIANDGPVLKRWMPRAHGRAAQILKRTSHIELVLGVRPGAKKKDVVKKEDKKEDGGTVKIVRPDEVKKEALKNLDKSQKGPKQGGKGGFLRGIFQRKTG